MYCYHWTKTKYIIIYCLQCRKHNNLCKSYGTLHSGKNIVKNTISLIDKFHTQRQNIGISLCHINLKI